MFNGLSIHFAHIHVIKGTKEIPVSQSKQW